MFGSIVGNDVGGAVGADGASQTAETVVLIGGDAVVPIGDGFEEVAGIVGVVDLFAGRVADIGWVGDAFEVIVDIVFVLNEVTIGSGEGFEPASFIIGAGDGGSAFRGGFQ